MVNPEKIDGQIRNLRRYTGYLEELARVAAAEFLGDPFKVGAAKYYLQAAIESCLDMANHLISAERLRAPVTIETPSKYSTKQASSPTVFSPPWKTWSAFAIGSFTSTGR